MEKNKDFSSLENECVQGEESKQRQNQEMETLLNAESESVEGGRDIDDGSLNPSGMCSIMSCQTNTYSQKEMVCELHKRNLRVRSDSNSSL